MIDAFQLGGIRNINAHADSVCHGGKIRLLAQFFQCHDNLTDRNGVKDLLDGRSGTTVHSPGKIGRIDTGVSQHRSHYNRVIRIACQVDLHTRTALHRGLNGFPAARRLVNVDRDVLGLDDLRKPFRDILGFVFIGVAACDLQSDLNVMSFRRVSAQLNVQRIRCTVMLDRQRPRGNRQRIVCKCRVAADGICDGAEVRQAGDQAVHKLRQARAIQRSEHFVNNRSGRVSACIDLQQLGRICLIDRIRVDLQRAGGVIIQQQITANIQRQRLDGRLVRTHRAVQQISVQVEREAVLAAGDGVQLVGNQTGVLHIAVLEPCGNIV